MLDASNYLQYFKIIFFFNLLLFGIAVMALTSSQIEVSVLNK